MQLFHNGGLHFSIALHCFKVSGINCQETCWLTSAQQKQQQFSKTNCFPRVCNIWRVRGMKPKGLNLRSWYPVNTKASQLLDTFLSCGLQKFDSQMLRSRSPLSTWQNLINYFRDPRVTFLMLVICNTVELAWNREWMTLPCPKAIRFRKVK